MADITSITAWSNFAIAIGTFLLVLVTFFLVLDSWKSRKEARKPEFVITTMNQSANNQNSSVKLMNTGVSVSDVTIISKYHFGDDNYHTIETRLPGVPREFVVDLGGIPMKKIIDSNGSLILEVNYTMIDGKNDTQEIQLDFSEIDNKSTYFGISIPLQHMGF